MTNDNLQNQIAVVTGASSGNGRGIAMELAKFGMDVLCLARRKEKLRAVVAEIEAAGGKASYYVTDVTDSVNLKCTIEDIIEDKGRIDLFVNNTGQNKVIGRTWEVDPDDMWQEMTVNAKGTMAATKLAVAQMVKQNSGRVINITGGGTTRPHVFASAYSASKAAIARFTETVAMELNSIDSPVKVFTVRPGLVLNERTQDLADSEACKELWPDIVDKINNSDQPMTTPDMVGDFIGYVASGALDDYDGRDLWIKMDREKLQAHRKGIRETDQLRLRMVGLD